MSKGIIEMSDNTLATIAPNAPVLMRPVAKPAELIEVHQELVAFVNKVLERGKDFGPIPGTDGNVLLKAGAERTCIGFGCYPSYLILEQEIDHDRENTYYPKWAKGQPQHSYGYYRYVVKCSLIHRESGNEVGNSIGSCSTMESKYISRPADCENTALKMAQKRAFVGATLNAFGLSDRFSADMEDVVDNRSADDSEAAQLEEQKRNVKDRMAQIGMKRADNTRYDALVKARKANYFDLAKEAFDAGCFDVQSFFAYVENGTLPERKTGDAIEGEFTQDEPDIFAEA